MTVREYIGARYVPLFMGDWDDSNTYEPLSIVQYQGDSYTSRQYVPTGIGIDNEAYWAITGNYNAQVEAYRAEVQTFDNRIDSLENTVGDADSGLVHDVAENTGDITTLEGVVGDSDSGLVHDVAENTGDITTLEGVVGDSDSGLVHDVAENAIATSRIKKSIKSDILPAITDGWFTTFSGRLFEDASNVLYPFTPQGIAIKNDNQIYVVLVNTVSNYVDVMLCNRSLNTVTKYATNIYMGHCNTMTYSPVKDRFYVVPGQSNLGDSDPSFYNVIFVYDNQFHHLETYSCPGTVGCISYDHVTEKLVYVDNETGYIYDVDEDTMQFTQRDVIMDTRTDVHSDPGTYVFQGGAVYDDFYVVPIGWNGLNDPNLVAVYDLRTGKFAKSYIYPECTDVFPLGELEDCAFDSKGMMYMSGGNPYSRNTNVSSQTTVFRCGIFADLPTGNRFTGATMNDMIVLASNQYYPTHTGFGFTFKEVEEAVLFAKYHKTGTIRINNPGTGAYWYKAIVALDGLQTCFLAADDVGIEGQLLIKNNAICQWYNGLRIKLPYGMSNQYPVRVFNAVFLLDTLDLYAGHSTPASAMQIVNTVMMCMNGEPTLHDSLTCPKFATARINGFGYRITPFTGQ